MSPFAPCTSGSGGTVNTASRDYRIAVAGRGGARGARLDRHSGGSRSYGVSPHGLGDLPTTVCACFDGSSVFATEGAGAFESTRAESARATVRAGAAGRTVAHRHQTAGQDRETRPPGPRRRSVYGAGWENAHVAVDDHSRVAYAEVLYNEGQYTCTDFLIRAVKFFRKHGVSIERVMTMATATAPNASIMLAGNSASATSPPGLTRREPTARRNASSAR